MDKKHQKCTKIGGYSPFATPQDFFSKSGSITFVPLWCTTLMQKVIKKLMDSLTDPQITAITKDPYIDGPLNLHAAGFKIS